MIENLQKYLLGFPPGQRPNALREYLQWLILQALDDGGYRPKLAFTGGTALRLIYGTQRFSEDLDFSLIIKKGYHSDALKDLILQRLRRWGLQAEVHQFKDERTVASFFIRFRELLQPLKLSPNVEQKMAIKVEVDKNPPSGGHVEDFLFQGPVTFLVNHYDLPSLFATKLHAFLFRRYDKGRDYYDLFFFLGKNIEPAMGLFRNAVRQTHPEEQFASWRDVLSAVRSKVFHMDEKKILADVERFLLKPEEARFLSKTVLLKAVDQALQRAASAAK